MDETMFKYKKRWNEVKESHGLEFPQSKIGFFEELEPIENAISVYNWLDEHFTVWILTAPSVPNVHSYSEKRLSIEKHLGIERCNRLIISPDKSLFYGDYLIDDTDTKGQLGFKGRLLRFGSEFKDWLDIAEFFGKILADKKEIDLDIYQKTNARGFAKDNAIDILKTINMNHFFEHEKVILNIPQNTTYITTSFLKTLFEEQISKLGREEFTNKLIINNLSNVDVDRDINEIITIVEIVKANK